MGALSVVLSKVLSSALVWGLEKFYIWIKNKHAEDKDNEKTTEAAKEFKKGNEVIADRIIKAEEITDEDVQKARKAARNLIGRFGDI